MYPTDEIFESIFNFTEKVSPNEHFETLGYEGANFISMTGSVIINILIAITLNSVAVSINKLALNCSEYSCMRKIGASLKLSNTVGAILVLYL
jgi:hypothetical protein